ncbi:MAG: hypothetical protein EBY85_04970, partial [Burkholderiaceae bacterium]|nr:hypothetical protein [Burkholderiaceae bacterium]
MSRSLLNSRVILVVPKKYGNKIGEDYVNLVSKISNNKYYVTDKMPVNFRLIGFIKIALPNAKVIHCNRLAKDTCFSIYKNYFGK